MVFEAVVTVKVLVGDVKLLVPLVTVIFPFAVEAKKYSSPLNLTLIS